MTLISPEQQLDLLFLFLLILFALFPEDCIIFAGLVKVWTFSRLLNYYLMFRAWLMYRQLRSDMAKIGMPAPPFRFVPIWQRQPPERKP
jgi:hypothetical protein